MRISDVLEQNNTTINEPSRGMRISEAVSEEKGGLELWALTEEKIAQSRPITPEEEDILRKRKDIELIRKYPTDLYSGVPSVFESFMQGVLPLAPPESQRPGVEIAHPIANAVGKIAGLLTTGTITAGIAPAVTYSKALSSLPTVAKFAAGRMAQHGVTFGLKELIDNMAEFVSGEPKDFEVVVGDVLTSTGFGVGLGAVGSISSPIARIPAEAAYGYTTAKMTGADNFEAGVNAGIFAVFGLFNTKNLSEAYKKAAFSGAKQSMVDRMVRHGYAPEKAENITTRYFNWAIAKNGGWAEQKIKDFDKFSEAMRKGWKVYVEPEMKPGDATALVSIKPPVKAPMVVAPLAPKVTPIAPEITPRVATPEQIKQAHVIASEKALISEKGKMKPQYRHLAEQMTSKTSIKEMTQEEAVTFIDALEGLPEPTYKAGKLVPPSIPRTTALVTEGYFERTFKKPTPAKLLTSQTRYAELLGVKELAEPFEIGKQKLDLEYGKVASQIDTSIGKLKKFKTTTPEKMAQLLNTYEETPPELSEQDAKVFNYFRDLTRDIINRENSVRMSLGLEPIKYRKAYFRHTADKMAQDVIDGKYPLPEGLKYWSEQIVGKKVYNPMEMQRKLRDDLLEHFSKDPAYVMKSMAWTGLKEIYLAQPKYYFNRILGALSKDKAIYKNLTPQEKAHYDAQMTIPASTKKWLIDYVNIVLSGRQTALDESVNLWITDTPIKEVVNNILRPFGKHIGQKPVTDIIGGISKLPIYGVMGGVRPKQIIRNKFQTLQNLALYGMKNTLLGFLPTSSYPTLESLKTDSLFRKSYSGFEDMPAELRGKVEKLGLAPYQWSAVSNVSQAMNSAYHWVADYIQNPAKKDLGWADPQRTYTEPKHFFYPSEKERLLKEMEYGAHTTQFQYIGMGMPEIYRYKALAGITRLQSWWMNHWFVFHREAATRAFTGRTGYDPDLKVTLGDRINYLKYLLIAGVILNTMGYERSYLLGTAPTSLPPTAQLALGLYTYFTHLGDTDWEKRKRGESERQIREAAKTFIPGYLSIKDLATLLSGEKDWTEYLWYKKEKPKPIRPVI